MSTHIIIVAQSTEYIQTHTLWAMIFAQLWKREAADFYASVNSIEPCTLSIVGVGAYRETTKPSRLILNQTQGVYRKFYESRTPYPIPCGEQLYFGSAGLARQASIIEDES